MVSFLDPMVTLKAELPENKKYTSSQENRIITRRKLTSKNNM